MFVGCKWKRLTAAGCLSECRGLAVYRYGCQRCEAHAAETAWKNVSGSLVAVTLICFDSTLPFYMPSVQPFLDHYSSPYEGAPQGCHEVELTAAETDQMNAESVEEMVAGMATVGILASQRESYVRFLQTVRAQFRRTGRRQGRPCRARCCSGCTIDASAVPTFAERKGIRRVDLDRASRPPTMFAFGLALGIRTNRRDVQYLASAWLVACARLLGAEIPRGDHHAR